MMSYAAGRIAAGLYSEPQSLDVPTGTALVGSLCRIVYR
jgi:hypothetical protein